MTISAYLHKWTKIIVVVRWVCVGVAAVMALVTVNRPPFERYAWVIGAVIPAIAVVGIYAKRLQCPICKARLREPIRDLGVPPALQRCPECGADFSQPMPNKAA